MHVSTILNSSVKTLGNTDKNYSKNYEKRNNAENINSELSEKSSRQELFNNINEWKSFCHRQILKNNIDYIA